MTRTDGGPDEGHGVVRMTITDGGHESHDGVLMILTDGGHNEGHGVALMTLTDGGHEGHGVVDGVHEGELRLHRHRLDHLQHLRALLLQLRHLRRDKG